MSFLFKSKKNQNSSLPQATREISSSHGAGSNIPQANGMTGFQQRVPSAAPGANSNNSLSSIPGLSGSPEPGRIRDRADSEPAVNVPGSLQNGRSNALSSRAPAESPYPWSQARFTFQQNSNPFPRYGLAANATAAKDGSVYLVGGLVNSSVVQGDLWIVEAGTPGMACYPVPTTAEGPSARVGHASLLVGNAFIVFGGDSKQHEDDVLDETLYLLNTSTKQWSKALPAGPRPSGRYGHSLNILDSKIYIFGGQVEGYFFNDLVAFDLNSLQSSSSRWEVLIPNSEGSTSVPPARTNHSVVSWNGRLYLFGGTDGERWFNDVWTYEPRSNAWMELDCIGYIPAAREGHAAALVGDTMYVFGGRTKEGQDLGDLAAFKISSRRWYMFQNMGPSPSPRSGHCMATHGKNIVVFGGEPSTAPRDPGELSLPYILDTSKIRYPASDTQPGPNDRPARKTSSDRGPPAARPAPRESVMGAFPRAPDSNIPSPSSTSGNSRLPRASSAGAPSGPPPQQQAPQAPQAKTNGAQGTVPRGPRAKTPTQGEKESSPVTKEGPSQIASAAATASVSAGGTREQSPAGQQSRNPYRKESEDSQSGRTPSRSGSRATRGQNSFEQTDRSASRPSTETPRSRSRQGEGRPAETPASVSEEFTKELEAAKSRNAWYASELALARKAGYLPNPSNNPILDERAADAFGDDDRPLIEALLKMRTELAKVQGSIDEQSKSAATKIAEIEKQRDAAIDEAIYAKAKFAAHGGSQAGTPQPESVRGMGTPDLDRVNELNRRLAATLNEQSQLAQKVESLNSQMEAEVQAKKIAEETAEVAQKRVTELDMYRQQNMSELEGLRSELHEAQKMAREESKKASEAESSARLLTVDKNELAAKLASSQGDYESHSEILDGLREAVTASTERASLLERKLEEEKAHRDSLDQKLTQLRSDYEHRTTELETMTIRLNDAEELAERNAEEARTHRSVVMAGFGKSNKKEGDIGSADERVTVLQQQVETANSLVRANQEAADIASEKLRRAEERIAGLEAYQEQASRESLAVRKQLQASMKELHSARSEKNDLAQQFERHVLNSNAVEVQLKTLKNLLEEKGVSANAEKRRSRALDSPNSRLGTPDMSRIRDLEQQLEASLKSHDELRSTFEQREQDVSREWAQKLEALDNDHQAAVKYLKGTEKMLTKMNSELQRYKATNAELEQELATRKAAAEDDNAGAAAWEEERATLHQNIIELEGNVKSSVQALENEITSLKSELASVQEARDRAAERTAELEASSSQHQSDMDQLKQENAQLSEKARDAEERVQMFLDQFETSVDNYRRESRMHTQTAKGLKGDHRSSIASGIGAAPNGHRGHASISESLYSEADSQSSDRDDGSSTPDASALSAQATRNSIALDSLATELDALRSHWETTNKHYRLSDRFDTEARTPVTATSERGDWKTGTPERSGSSAGTRATPTAATAAGGVI